MTIKRNRLMRVAAGVTATAVVGSLGVFATTNTVNAAPGDGGATLSVSSGTEATEFDLGLLDPGSQICPADSVSGNAGTPNENFRASGFITKSDPATLNFAGANFGGAPGVADDGLGTAFPLVKSNGDFVINSLPAQPNGNLQLIDFAALDFQNPVGQSLSDGVWNIGIACFDGDTPGLPQERFWSTPITISGYSAGAFSWVEGANLPPEAPVLSLGTGTGTTQEIIINNPDSSLDSYILDVNLPLADPLPTVNPGDTSFVLTGLTLGTSYDVELDAVKSGFGGETSNTLSFTAAATFEVASVSVLDIFEGDDALVEWAAPTSGPTPLSYDVEILQGATSVQLFSGVANLSQAVSGLALGSYTATVTPNYAAGSGATGAPRSDDGFEVRPNALIVQEITVTRPPGALILTQRCGVFGPLDAYTADAAFPGFPFDLPARSRNGGFVGTSPDIDLVTPGVQADPEFANYPFPNPPTYPTECGLDMGTASFVTSGPFAGQFFAADGRLNQVTVADTRDDDAGWTARGDIEDLFTGSTGDTFSGDFLGWVPSVESDSDPSGTFTYDQLVTPGPAVPSGTTAGLTDNPVLASAPAGNGLGIAALDARMTLLIPLEADAADYAATLSLTVV